MKTIGNLRTGLVIGMFGCLVAGLTGPSRAEKLYVPFVVELTTSEGFHIDSEIRLTNDSGKKNAFRWIFIAGDQDGTLVDRDQAQKVRLAKNVSTQMRDFLDDGQAGFLEIDAAEDISLSARLRVVNAEGKTRIGNEIPIVSGRTAIPALETANLMGLKREPDGAETDLHLLNLGTTASHCGIEVYRSGGKLIFDVVVEVKPESLTSFADAFDTIDREAINEARFAVTCDQPFYPFAIHRDLETAGTLFIGPAPTGREGLGPTSAFQCPSDALLSRAGVFHTVTQGHEIKSFVVPQKGGQSFDRLTIDMTMKWGGYFPPTRNLHNIFWIQRNDKWTGNLFGYLNAQAGSANHIKLETNVGLPRNQNSTAAAEGIVLKTGETYSVYYEYNTARQRILTRITTDEGTKVAEFTTPPTVRTIRTIDQGWYFQVGIPADAKGPENPTYGTSYGNLCIQLR